MLESNSYLPDPFKGLSDEQLLEQWPHAFRFRDSEFVEKWERWQHARNSWRTTWPTLDTFTPVFFTDAECPDHPVAREFVAARRAYINDLEARSAREGL